MNLLLLQLSDSAFPAGGFTHSGGIEAARHYGEIRTVEDVERVARIMVRQTGRGSLPFVAAAHRAPEDLPALDAHMDLFLNQPVSNRASRAQGQALLQTAMRVFPAERVAQLAKSVARQNMHGHLAPIFGTVMRSLDIDVDDAAELFLYQSARSAISAAVRLGVIGVFDSQRIQQSIAGDIAAAVPLGLAASVDDAAQTAPILDLYQSTHDRLYSRLFQS